MVRVRGHAKVMTHLRFGIIALTADQLLRFVTYVWNILKRLYNKAGRNES